MAIAFGQGGQVKVGAGSSTAAVVGQVRGFSMEYNNELVDVTVLEGQLTANNGTGRKFAKGLENNTISLDCYFDEADAPQDVMVAGAEINFELYPIATDGQYYTGDGIVQSLSMTVAGESLVEVSFSIQVNGKLTVEQG